MCISGCLDLWSNTFDDDDCVYRYSIRHNRFLAIPRCYRNLMFGIAISFYKL